MRTLAEIKRRMIPGATLTVTNHARPHISGPRIVAKTQTRDVAFDFPPEARPANLRPGQFSWLTWPKAADVRFDGPDVFTILDHERQPFLTVTFDNDAATAPAARRVRAGDAVRLTSRAPGMPELAIGAVGVIGGMLGEDIDHGSIMFNPSTFRDDRAGYVSCSGGPGTIWTSVDELRPTDETVELNVWRWNKYGRGAGNGEPYTVTVPLWDWHPTTNV